MPASDGPQLIHHGARHSVTGSCHELCLPRGSGLLVDCGLFQGKEADRALEIDFPVKQLCGLVLTHVHIDHVGRLPYLIAAGFKGPIFCSKASALLLPTVLEDALKISFTRDKRQIEHFLAIIKKQLRPLEYNGWQQVETTKTARLAIRRSKKPTIYMSSHEELLSG